MVVQPLALVGDAKLYLFNTMLCNAMVVQPEALVGEAKLYLFNAMLCNALRSSAMLCNAQHCTVLLCISCNNFQKQKEKRFIAFFFESVS